jgi:hypothetical protein
MSDVISGDVADTAAVAKRKDAKTAVDAELVGQLVAPRPARTGCS